MKIHHRLVLAALVPVVACFDPLPVWGWGAYPRDSNEAIFRAAIESSNASRSVPFQLGRQTFQLQASVANVQIPGGEASQEDLAAAFTQYTLAWDGDASLNSTVGAAENVTDGQQPRLCGTIPMGLFTASVTNGYDFGEPGSCAGALGKKCADAFTSARFGGNIDDCRPPVLPDECSGKLPGGGLGTSSLLYNTTLTSPRAFAYYSKGSQAGSPDASDTFSQEENRLHMFIFASQDSYYPVCLRIRDEKVSKGDPSTGGALRQMVGVSWPLSLASLLLVAVFFWP